jgi:hypothetical protein
LAPPASRGEPFGRLAPPASRKEPRRCLVPPACRGNLQEGVGILLHRLPKHFAECELAVGVRESHNCLKLHRAHVPRRLADAPKQRGVQHPADHQRACWGATPLLVDDRRGGEQINRLALTMKPRATDAAPRPLERLRLL